MRFKEFLTEQNALRSFQFQSADEMLKSLLRELKHVANSAYPTDQAGDELLHNIQDLVEKYMTASVRIR